MKPRLLQSLQFKIFFITLLIVFIPLVVLGYVYYTISTDLITEKLQKADENMVNQIGENLEFVLEDTNDLSLFFLQSEQAQQLLNPSYERDEQEIRENQQSVSRLLLHLIGSKDYYASIQIDSMDMALINTHYQLDPLSEDVKDRLQDLNGGGQLITDLEKGTIVYARLVKDINNVTEALGYISIQLEAAYIEELFKNKHINETEHYFLLDSDGKIIVQNNDNKAGSETLAKLLSTDATGDQQSEVMKVKNRQYIKTTKQLEGTDLTIVHLAALDELMGGNEVFSRLIIVALIVSLLICTFAAYQFSRYIVRPIIHLQSLMKQVDNGKFDVRFKARGNNEIDLLGKEFNSMLYRTNFLIKLIYSAEIRKKDAEIKALYAQINPHFLYNTLDSIYWMGQMENAPKSAKMTHALAKLFRIMLKDQSDITTVATELEYVEHYIEIQKMRYEEMIDLHLDIQAETNDAKTIKLVLQPLIENAITHGIEPKAEGGTIFIRIKKVADLLEIVVEDDGLGADVTKLNKQMYTEREEQDEGGIALQNIHERIVIRDGADYGLTFSNSDKGGLKVIVQQKWEV